MNSDAVRARNARKRAKLRAKSRGESETFWRCQVIFSTVLRTARRSSYVQETRTKCHFNTRGVPHATLEERAHRTTRNTMCEQARSHRSSFYVFGTQQTQRDVREDYFAYVEPSLRSRTSQWILITTHELTDSHKEVIDVTYKAFLKDCELHFRDIDNSPRFATIVTQKGGDERRSTWRIEELGGAADVAVAILTRGLSQSLATS